MAPIPITARFVQALPPLPAMLREAGYAVALAGKWHVAPAEAFPFESLPLDPHAVGQWLAETHDRPFCLVVATHLPHKPYRQPPEGQAQSLDDIDVPPFLLDTAETRKELREHHHTAELLDAQIGAFVQAVDQRSDPAETLLLYTSDHGPGFPFAKWTLYDQGLRIPLIARWLGQIAPGTTSEAMVSTTDLLPTLLEAAGVPHPDDLDGRSILPLLRGDRNNHRDRIFATHTQAGAIGCTQDYPIRAVRTERFKLILNLAAEVAFTNIITSPPSPERGESQALWCSWQARAARDENAASRLRLYQHRPPRELYDLQQDCYELNNLAEAPSHAAIVAELEADLRAWMNQQSDPLLHLVAEGECS